MQNLEIFSSMKIKLLLNDNKIEEAKLYIHTYFFKTMTHYCFIDVFNNNIQTIADKDLKIYIPSDLNNSIYLTENTVKKNEYKRFSVISYLRETEFFDIGNMCREKVNFNYPRGLVHIDGQKCLNFARSLKINPVNDFKIDDFKNEIKATPRFKSLLRGSLASGGSATGNRGTSPTSKTATRAEFDAMSHAHRSKFFADGGKIN